MTMKVNLIFSHWNCYLEQPESVCPVAMVTHIWLRINCQLFPPFEVRAVFGAASFDYLPPLSISSP